MPDKKCLYKGRMESADSIASMDSTSRKRVPAGGAGNVEKYAEKYLLSLPIMYLSLYNKFVVYGKAGRTVPLPLIRGVKTLSFSLTVWMILCCFSVVCLYWHFCQRECQLIFLRDKQLLL